MAARYRHDVVRGPGGFLDCRSGETAVVAVGGLPHAVCSGVDWAIHRALLRRQATVVLQGSAIPDDRSAVAAELHLSQAWHPLLAIACPVSNSVLVQPLLQRLSIVVA